MSTLVQQILLAVGWSVFATILAQAISILFMRGLGLPIKKLVHEIEEIQNPAGWGNLFCYLADGWLICRDFRQ